jgi:toxin ParE1/3/4
VNLRFIARAAQDLRDIANYVKERNPGAALRVRAAILESLQNLVMFPQAGRQQNIEGVRKLATILIWSIIRLMRRPRKSLS